MMVIDAVRHWIEQHTTHESPEVERELIDAQRDDALRLVARLDAAERKIADARSKAADHDA